LDLIYFIKNYEEGLREFLFAKNKSQLKDAIEDMYTACDEIAKIVLGNKNKGFKHVFKNDDSKKIGFSTKYSKELFRNLKDWMDSIKHGTIKNYDRHDVEIIINTVSSFLRLLANKNS